MSDVDHRSQVFSKLLEKMGYANIAKAVSSADLGILGGAPVNPNLRPGAGRDYSTIRFAEGQYTYTMVHVDVRFCRTCGKEKLERHRLTVHHDEQGVVQIGSLSMCANCQAESWMFKGHMPSVVAARKRDAKVVP